MNLLPDFEAVGSAGAPQFLLQRDEWRKGNVMMWKITYKDSKRDPEEVEADRYEVAAPWIAFTKTTGGTGAGSRVPVLRIREDDIARIDLIDSCPS